MKMDTDIGEYIRTLDGTMKRLETTSDLREGSESTNDDIRGPADIYGEPSRCKA